MWFIVRFYLFLYGLLDMGIKVLLVIIRIIVFEVFEVFKLLVVSGYSVIFKLFCWVL